MAEQLEFAHVFEGLFMRGLKDHLDDRLKARLKEKGLDLSKPLDPAYPSHVLSDCIIVAAQTVYPSLPLDQALNAVGHAFFRGYTGTMLGQAMLQLLRLLGPRRTLERMQRNFRTGNNYMETRFKALGPQNVELWFNETRGIPAYFQGILEQGGNDIGAKNMQVSYRDDPAGGTWFAVTWA